MSKEQLEAQVLKFRAVMEERLAKLSPEEKKQYLDAAYLVVDTLFRASPQSLTPFERVEFMSMLRSEVYSKAHHLNLDTATMEELERTNAEGIVATYVFAKTLQEALEIPLDLNQVMHLKSILELYGAKIRE